VNSTTPRTGPWRPAFVGDVTRGTTHANRLRRVDAWTVGTFGGALRSATAPPLVVDLGFGASPVTTLELAHRIQQVRPDAEVVGTDLDAARVAAASAATRGGQVRFVRCGFDLASLQPRRAMLIRAFNVLRQYDECDVAPAWTAMARRLTPEGAVIDGTCDELGRIAAWIRLDAAARPTTLTFAVRLASFNGPSELAERLPKALIHRNTEGERIHELLQRWQRAWDAAAGAGVFGARDRWIAAADSLRQAGVRMRGDTRRWRLGELDVDWAEVAPCA
jgi:hypothetical protein